MNIKKTMFLLLLIAAIISLTSCGQNASGKNIKVESVLDSCVEVRPVCPDCHHIGRLVYANISEEENFNSKIICEGCKKSFEITVQR